MSGGAGWSRARVPQVRSAPSEALGRDKSGSSIRIVTQSVHVPDPDPVDRGEIGVQAPQWEVSDNVAGGVAYVLSVARKMVILANDDRDLALPAATWGLLALERCIIGCVGARLGKPVSSHVSLADLIDMAKTCDLISNQEADVLHGVRRLRNHIIHGALYPTSFGPTDASEMLQSIHEAISDIYDRATIGK